MQRLSDKTHQANMEDERKSAEQCKVYYRMIA